MLLAGFLVRPDTSIGDMDLRLGGDRREFRGLKLRRVGNPRGPSKLLLPIPPKGLPSTAKSPSVLLPISLSPFTTVQEQRSKLVWYRCTANCYLDLRPSLVPLSFHLGSPSSSHDSQTKKRHSCGN